MQDADAPTSPEPAGRTCPRPGCTKLMSVGVYACYVHWSELPPVIRGRISQAWWAFRRTGSAESLEAHRRARAEAEAWWAANDTARNDRLGI